jgi:hypothetical protein
LVRIRRPDRANAEPTFSEVAFICHYRCAHTGGEDHRQLRSDYGADGAYRHDVVGAGHVAVHLDDWFERKHVGALLPVGLLDRHLLHVIGHEWRQGGACCQEVYIFERLNRQNRKESPAQEGRVPLRAATTELVWKRLVRFLVKARTPGNDKIRDNLIMVARM